jgi:hypothetical protein
MREIANLANIFSTEGLDSYNRGLIDEVKNIAHKCTEQFEEMPKEKASKKDSQKHKQKDHQSNEYE